MVQTEFQPILTLRKEGSRPPLFCLYGITGDVAYYMDLVEALGNDQPVVGIRSAGLEDEARLPKSMEEAATEAIRFIRKIQPTGSPSLVGYSWGGLLAFEVARQLAKTEGSHCFVTLIGTEAPLKMANFPIRFLHFIRYFPGWLWDLALDSKRRRQRLKRWDKMALSVAPNLTDPAPPSYDHCDADAVAGHAT